MKNITIRGLSQNNLKNINLDIPKHKIVIFTGVSGSGKSSIVFDTIASQSQRQMNETYPAYVRGRLPKYSRPNVEKISNLTPSVIVDQTSLKGNVRSTVGTISDLYTDLRLLFSRIGKPEVGTASHFSFNDPNGMCPECCGLGKVNTIDIHKVINFDKSLHEGCINDSTYAPNTWYWKQYAESGLFDLDRPVKEYSKENLNLFLYGSRDGKSKPENPKVIGLYHKYNQTYLTRDMSSMSKTMKEKSKLFVSESSCTSCHGKRLNQVALSSKILNYSIADMCEMDLSKLLVVLQKINNDSVKPLLDSLINGVSRMVDIGLAYLHLNRETSSLSGGEAQRLKLIRYMGSSLSDITYIFDEPSSGLHPHDVKKMNQLLLDLRDNDNTVIVVEHDRDVIAIADEIIDIGMYAGKLGGEVVFQGSYKNLLQSDTLTAKSLQLEYPVKTNTEVRKAKGYLSIENANTHNLKNISVTIPMGVMNVITGVAGSGKSTLISHVLVNIYKDIVIEINQSPIVATNRSTPASFLGFFDDIRTLFAKSNMVDKNHFSFNSKGACPHCIGRGVIVTELVYMDAVISECEYCKGKRYNKKTLQYLYKGKNIIDILAMSVYEALQFFDDKKITRKLETMKEVGLSYMTLGQPLSTLSGGERQRIKLAKNLDKKGSIYILDEPTTGLHLSDIHALMILFNKLVERGNTVIIIEHNLEVIKQADWIIDIGPKGGDKGGEIIFEGTPTDMLINGNTLTAKCLRKSFNK